MTEKRQKLIDRFDKWLDSKPRKQIISAQCANIAEEYAQEQLLLHNVSKRYKFTFKDEDGLLIIVNEDTERKAFKKAFRSYETPKDRELTIVSKEVNAC